MTTTTTPTDAETVSVRLERRSPLGDRFGILFRDRHRDLDRRDAMIIIRDHGGMSQGAAYGLLDFVASTDSAFDVRRGVTEML